MNVYIQIAIAAATALHWFHKKQSLWSAKNRLCFFLLLLFCLFSVGNFFFQPMKRARRRKQNSSEFWMKSKTEIWMIFFAITALCLFASTRIFFSHAKKKLQIKIFLAYLNDFHLLRSWMNIFASRNVTVGQWLECILDFVKQKCWFHIEKMKRIFNIWILWSSFLNFFFSLQKVFLS